MKRSLLAVFILALAGCAGMTTSNSSSGNADNTANSGNTLGADMSYRGGSL